MLFSRFPIEYDTNLCYVIDYLFTRKCDLINFPLFRKYEFPIAITISFKIKYMYFTYNLSKWFTILKVWCLATHNQFVSKNIRTYEKDFILNKVSYKLPIVTFMQHVDGCGYHVFLICNNKPHECEIWKVTFT